MAVEGQNIPDYENCENNAERLSRELLALSRVSAALSELSDLDAILRITLDNVLQITNGTVGGILLLDEESKTLSYRVYHGLTSDIVEKIHLKLGESISGKVAESNKAVFLEDTSKDPNITFPELLNVDGLKTFISIPLRAKQQVFGVITIASQIQRRFTQTDISLFYAIGDQLGIAIEYAMLYERLRKARERLRRLARQNLVAEEEERRRIARELHDETSQSLSGLSLQLEAIIEIAQLNGNLSADFIGKLKKVQSLTVHVHKEVSHLISNLHPALLDTLGLVPAIRQYAETSLQPLGINVFVETLGNVKRLPSDIEATLFRVIQGAIGNVAQHSKARNAIITLEYRPDQLLFKLKDDGQGFDVSKITDIEEGGRGRGLFSMRERIGFLGGTSGIDSKLGTGTTVWANIPIGQEFYYAEKNKSPRS
ncbi:MAG: GAF domain-containing protein [Dehalococcoidales bacterium]|nr:GAF domain-containing protein [Dehalococcoidales bacterium]